jgi:glyoxylase-like metal-dependent hydrolase (beta-lactamase superfamily II)
MFIEQRQVGPMAVFAYLVATKCRVRGSSSIRQRIGGASAAAEKNNVPDQVYRQHPRPRRSYRGQCRHEKADRGRIIIHQDDAWTDRYPAAMLRMFGAKPSPPADRTVSDGDLIQVGGITLKVVHTPGHSPGSMVLFGRLCLHRRHPVRGGRGKDRPAGGSGEVMFDSIQRRLAHSRTRRWSFRDTTTEFVHLHDRSKKSTILFYDKPKRRSP